MSKNRNIHFSKWLYKTGGAILFFLALVALIAFIKALSVKECQVDKNPFHYADSIQIEALKREVKDLNRKVDSLLILSQREPQKVYRYLKPKKDSSIIEVNIHNK